MSLEVIRAESAGGLAAPNICPTVPIQLVGRHIEPLQAVMNKHFRMDNRSEVSSCDNIPNITIQAEGLEFMGSLQIMIHLSLI